jgi:dual oxidase
MSVSGGSVQVCLHLFISTRFCVQLFAFFSSNFQPSISYWLYGSITGITGILLVIFMSVIYVFAAPAVLKQAYHAFRITHLLNILLYALTIAHGLPKLLDVS